MIIYIEEHLSIFYWKVAQILYVLLHVYFFLLPVTVCTVIIEWFASGSAVKNEMELLEPREIDYFH